MKAIKNKTASKKNSSDKQGIQRLKKDTGRTAQSKNEHKEENERTRRANTKPDKNHVW